MATFTAFYRERITSTRYENIRKNMAFANASLAKSACSRLCVILIISEVLPHLLSIFLVTMTSKSSSDPTSNKAAASFKSIGIRFTFFIIQFGSISLLSEAAISHV